MGDELIRKGQLMQMTTTQIQTELQPGCLAYDTTTDKVVYRNKLGVLKTILDATTGADYIDATELAAALEDYQLATVTPEIEAAITEAPKKAGNIAIAGGKVYIAIAATANTDWKEMAYPAG